MPTLPDPNLSDVADRTHSVYWGSRGCVLPYRHAGPCICDCVLEAAERLPDGRLAIIVEEGDVGAPPYYGAATSFFGDDVYSVALPIAAEFEIYAPPGGWPRWTGATPQEL